MMSPWLLLPLLFTLARALSGPRHPEGRPGSPDGPTCEQLRAFWEIISRTTKIGQITNEIPILPLEAYNALDRLTTGSRRKIHRVRPFGKISQDIFSNQLDVAQPFPEQLFKMQQPIQPDPIIPLQPDPFVSLQPGPPSDQDLMGMFGEFHEHPPAMSMIPNQPRTEPEMSMIPNQPQMEPELIGFGSSSAVPLNSKKKEENEFYIPQWGSPDEVDSFGSFIDFDIGHRAMTRTPKDAAVGERSGQRIASRQESSQVACSVLVNTDCNISEQCACRGLNLICMHGKCLNHDLNRDIREQYGTWHNGPIPQSQLRLLTRLRKRSKKSNFM